MFRILLLLLACWPLSAAAERIELVDRIVAVVI
jgi:hypothetical protein